MMNRASLFITFHTLESALRLFKSVGFATPSKNQFFSGYVVAAVTIDGVAGHSLSWTKRLYSSCEGLKVSKRSDVLPD
jgi:hypothetical protein